jgi:hypothetical protein
VSRGISECHLIPFKAHFVQLFETFLLISPGGSSTDGHPLDVTVSVRQEPFDGFCVPALGSRFSDYEIIVIAEGVSLLAQHSQQGNTPVSSCDPWSGTTLHSEPSIEIEIFDAQIVLQRPNDPSSRP